MKTFNMHYAKTHLSRLVELAAAGEPFVIAKAGRPLVTVTGFAKAPERAPRRIGFMEGRIQVPDEIDRFAEQEINEMFGLD